MDKKLRILVTGANGFVGKHLLMALIDAGYKEIIGVYRQKEVVEIAVRWIKVELTQIEILEEELAHVDVVIHLAGLVSYDEGDRNSLMLNNYQVTKGLINACLTQKVKKFIYLSSASTLTKSNFPFEISDTLQGKPIFYSNYAKSKYLGELEVHRGAAEGLKATILNPCLILGEGDWSKGSLCILQRIAQGLKYYPKGSIGIVDVKVVVREILHSIEVERAIGPHLLFGIHISYYDFIIRVANQLGIEAPTKSLSLNQAKLFSSLERLKCWLFGRKKVITKETAFLSSQTFKYIRNKGKMESLGDSADLEKLISRSLSQNINK